MENIRNRVEIKADRLHQDSAKIVTVTVAGKEKQISVSKKELQKTATKVAEEKRAEITQLQKDIDQKKQDAEMAGVIVLEEARKEASEIVKSAKNEAKAVKSLQESLVSRHEEIEKRFIEQELAQDTLDKQAVSQKDQEIRLKQEKEQIERDRSDVLVARELACGLLTDLTALVGVAVDRVKAIGEIEVGQKEQLVTAKTLAEETIRLMNNKDRKLEAKAEFLANKDKQLETKWDIIKEDRVRFLALKGDPMFRN